MNRNLNEQWNIHFTDVGEYTDVFVKAGDIMSFRYRIAADKLAYIPTAIEQAVRAILETVRPETKDVSIKKDIEELCNHVNPHIAEALRAAAVATSTGTDEDIAVFQRLCRPAEYILLVRRAVELESGMTPNAGAQAPSEAR